MILLEWLLHLLNIPQQPTEIKQQDVIVLTRRLLLKIDAQHFKELNDEYRYGCNQDQEFLEIFTHVASYLTVKDFKKLNCQFQKEVLANRNTEELLEIVLYVAVNSDIKKEAIESILDFEEVQQCRIMKTIQNIEGKCQQVVELKKIVEKIQNIQQENELLRAKIAMNQEQYHCKVDMIQEIQAWNAIISKQNTNYEQEKQSIFKQLDITHLREFTEICHLNKKQNEEITNSLEQLQGESDTLIKDNAKLKRELKHCALTIQKQIKDIEDLKIKCKILNQEYWLSDCMINGETVDIPELPLRDNKNILNTEEGVDVDKRKLATDRTECSARHQDLEESFEIKNNLHVLLSLQELERQYQQRLNEIQRLKQEKIDELTKQRKLDRKVRKLKECHHFFMEQYQNTKVIKI